VKERSSGGSDALGAASARSYCVVLHPVLPTPARDERRSSDARLAEMVGLAEAIDLEVAHAEVIRVASARPSTLLGSGAVDRLKSLIEPLAEERSDRPVVVVIDAPVSPVQQRNLEKAWQAKVIDRTGLILEIFGARARTREGELQVELAALVYQRSRLVRSWTHLERQRGGFGFLGGPGETQLETDRRIIGERIQRLKRDLEQVRRTRSLHRQARQRVPYAIIALVGYTNAGKSTLFNRLTDGDVAARDQLFATLDPTMRGLVLPSGERAILSDTVGFISDLPHQLVEAFRATLEEVTEADIVVHVRDGSHPDSDAQRDDVIDVLNDLGVGEAAGQPVVEVLNKIDLMSADDRERAANRVARANIPVVLMSAATGEGCDRLLALLDAEVGRQRALVELSIPVADGARLAWLYEHGEVVDRHDGEDRVALKVRLTPARAAQFAQRYDDRLAGQTGGLSGVPGGTRS
jgi:GTP-binding protein HflX